MEARERTPTSLHFKPETSARLLIDHQVGTLPLIEDMPSDVSSGNAVASAKAAEAFGIPILMTTSQQYHVQGPVADALQRVAPAAFASRIKRIGVVNAWDDPAFRDTVPGLDRRQLVMAAVTTEICLVSPAIGAVEEGFEVQAVLDASGSPFDFGDEVARRRMECAGVWLTSTKTTITELIADWTTPAGQQLAPVMFASAPMYPVD